jgi:hypothetical protein
MMKALDGLTVPAAIRVVAEHVEDINQAREDRRSRCALTAWEVGGQALVTAGSNGAACATAAGALSCDACVDTRQVRWTTPEDDEVPLAPIRGHLGTRLLHAVRNFQRLPHGPIAAERLHLTRFGKLSLDAKTQEQFAQFATTADEKDAHQLKLHRLLGMVEWHLHRSNIAPSAPLARRSAEMGARTVAQHGAIEEIERLAGERGFRIAPIKGLRTSQLYPARQMRHFSDFDYLTPGLDEAVRFADALLETLDYRFTSDTVPFSLKVVHDAAGKEVLTGHFHLVRRRVSHVHAVDVNFPGIPLGLLDTTHFPNVGSDGVDWSDQLAVTLAHLLKHDIAFMKDINDVLLMFMNAPALSLEVVRRYQLDFAAKLVVEYLICEMDFDVGASSAAGCLVRETSSVERTVIHAILRRGWPYDIMAHRIAQAVDITLRRRARWGTVRAFSDLVDLLAPRAKPVAPQVGAFTSLFGEPLHTRVYLVPLVRFSVDASRIAAATNWPADIQRIPECAAWLVSRRRVRLIVLPIGIFLATADWSVAASSREVESFALDICRALDVPPTPWAE